jgi:chromosome segregation ATPase
MESIKAELEAECAEKDTEIAELKDETNTKDTEIAALKDTCNEREQIVIRLDAGLKAHIAAAAAREQRSQGSKGPSRELSARLELLSSLPADAASWAQNLHDKDVHIGNIEAIVKNREEQIAQLASDRELREGLRAPSRRSITAGFSPRRRR